MNYPAGWKDYINAAKELGIAIDEKFAVWASRFRAAKSLKSLNFDELSQASSDSFFVATKLTFVDTALESLEFAAGVKTGSIAVLDQDLSYSLWDERTNELGAALARLDNRGIRAEWDAFVAMDSDAVQAANIRFLLRAFRHLNSHGSFTPGSAAVYGSEKHRSLLLQLAEAGLRAMELHFDKVLKSGQLPLQAELDKKFELMADLPYRGSMYVGHISDIDLLSDGNLVISRWTGRQTQVLDIHTWQLGEMEEKTKADYEMSVSGLDLDFGKQKTILEKLGTTKMSMVGWSWSPRLEIIGSRLGFSLYDPIEQQILETIPLPSRDLPGFLNSHQLSRVGEHQALVVIDDSKPSFALIDLESRLLRIFEVDNLPTNSTYLFSPELGGYAVHRPGSLQIDFFGPHDLPLPKCAECSAENIMRTGVWADSGFQVKRDGSEVLLHGNGTFYRVPFDGAEPETLFGGRWIPPRVYVSPNWEFMVDVEMENSIRKLDRNLKELSSVTFGTKTQMVSARSPNNAPIFIDTKGSQFAILNPIDMSAYAIVDTGLNEIHDVAWFSENRYVSVGTIGDRIHLALTENRSVIQTRDIGVNLDGGYLWAIEADPSTGRVFAFKGGTTAIHQFKGDILSPLEVIDAPERVDRSLLDSDSRQLFLASAQGYVINVLDLDSVALKTPISVPSPVKQLSAVRSTNELFALCNGGYLMWLPLDPAKNDVNPVARQKLQMQTIRVGDQTFTLNLG